MTQQKLSAGTRRDQEKRNETARNQKGTIVEERRKWTLCPPTHTKWK